MKINTRFWIFLAALLVFGILPLSAQQDAAASVIFDHFATRNFIAGTIPEADLNRIVQAGIRAPSARNLQPWHFTVVQNAALAKKIISQCENGNAVIVVSAQGDAKTNNVQILDCALAVQSIYLAAQALGYGSRIYTAPIDSINNNLKTELSLPKGHSAIAVIRVGRIAAPAPDAVSAASTRKNASELVTHKK